MNEVDLSALLDDLAAPDPTVRDERGVPAIAEAIQSEALTGDQVSTVATRMLEHLDHDEIQARTFAPLVLDILIEHGHWEDVWFDRTRAWYLAETDLRGHDPTLGWLHAVAHGADFFGAVAHLGRGPAADCLEVLVERLLLPADLVWRDQEEVRVAYAMALCLIQDPTALGAFEPVEGQLAAADGPPPVWATNTLHTLHALAAGLEQQVAFNGEPVDMPDLSVKSLVVV